MDMNAVLKLAPQLAQAVLARASLIEGGSTLTDYHVMSLDKRLRVLAADLDAACKAEQSFVAWSPHNQRDSFKPVSS